MDHAVVFLVFAGELVLLDLAGGVVVGVRAKHETVLGALAHSLGVDVVALLGVAPEPALGLPFLEVLHGLVVDAGIVVFEDGVEVDFGLGDVQQALGTGHGLGFLRIEDVVRRCSHLGDYIFGRPDGRKGFNSYHF